MSKQARAPLVAPGMVWGQYPEVPESRADRSALQRWWHAAHRRRGNLRAIGALARDAQRKAQAMIAARAPNGGAGLVRLDQIRLDQLRLDLRRNGLGGAHTVAALALVASRIDAVLGLRLHPNQYQCALHLLNQSLAEMATGEGKTLAAAAAAAVAALAGAPVHLLTANDYLAQRDAQQLAPLFADLGLSVDAALQEHAPARRRTAYRADVVYATARTVAFDYLRDRLSRQQRPGAISRDEHVNFALDADGADSTLLLRGLCFAIVDEADGILLDEARTPLIIADAQHDPAERGRLWQALDLARALSADRDFWINRAERRVELTGDGRERLAAQAREYGGAWVNAMHRNDMVTQALTALHLLARDVDYIVREDEVVIVDPTTGRSAPGRQWSMGLHALVALKERLPLPLASRTLASLTYPRLFARYHHLCGLSGTLHEDRGELLKTYGLTVQRVERHRPLQRRVAARRCFADRGEQFHAAVARAVELSGAGRPVLIATDTVEESAALARQFEQAGVTVAVLNASQSDQEAAVIAAAGQPGVITIATQMAGRGTDIGLAPAVAALGGLHVLNLQLNRSARIDRQIEGRCARQGDPGSSEHWLRIGDSALAADAAPALIRHLIGSLSLLLRPGAPSWLGHAGASLLLQCYQGYCRIEDAGSRRQVLHHDRHWSNRLHFATISE